MSSDLTGQTVELLQALIRNACVNDGTATSGHETRNSQLLQQFLGSTGLELQSFGPTPERQSLVARIQGTDPTAPSLCLMGHTDVVPVNEAGWSRDPFGGELIDGEVWGRGAVDMLNLTASMAVAFRHLATTGFRPKGDLIFFAVADEESGSEHGMRWMADHDADAIRADFVLTENGGLHSGPREAPYVGINVGEKGVAWRRLRVRGTPGHGSTPFKADNALLTAAAVVQRIGEYRPAPKFHELWRTRVETLGVDDDVQRDLLDPERIDAFLDACRCPARAPICTRARTPRSRATPSAPAPTGPATVTRMKTNVIPDCVDIGVDVRTLPGEGARRRGRAPARRARRPVRPRRGGGRDERPCVHQPHRHAAVGFAVALASPSRSRRPAPRRSSSSASPIRVCTARWARWPTAPVCSAPTSTPADFGRRFHGNDERVDVESLRLTTNLWLD
jgi:acetylornithine deacetylase/succinyl-diaminopimelate desuccinylase-like protein